MGAVNEKGQLICLLLCVDIVKEEKKYWSCEELGCKTLKKVSIFSRFFKQLSSKRKRQIKLNVTSKDFEMGILHDADISNLTQYFRSEISKRQQHFQPSEKAPKRC